MGRDRYSVSDGDVPRCAETARGGFQRTVSAHFVRLLRLESRTTCKDILCRLFFRFFTQNTGWTLPALFSMLRDLRDLAFDVSFLLDMLVLVF